MASPGRLWRAALSLPKASVQRLPPQPLPQAGGVKESAKLLIRRSEFDVLVKIISICDNFTVYCRGGRPRPPKPNLTIDVY